MTEFQHDEIIFNLRCIKVKKEISTMQRTVAFQTRIMKAFIDFICINDTTQHTDPASTRDLRAMKASCALERGRD